ncbi:MAG: hypothetical protein AMXMBFR34_43500 [Myxococcaceae bacterium]
MGALSADLPGTCFGATLVGRVERKKPPDVDVTDRDLDPVDTNPGDTRRPQDTADDEPEVPISRATSTTQLLDDEVVAGPTLDLLPPVKQAPKHPPEEPAPAPKASPKKPAAVLEASSAPVSRKLARKKLLGKEDQFESAASGQSLDDVSEVPTATRAASARGFAQVIVLGALGGLLLLALLAWLFW